VIYTYLLTHSAAAGVTWLRDVMPVLTQCMWWSLEL